MTRFGIFSLIIIKGFSLVQGSSKIQKKEGSMNGNKINQSQKK